MNPFVAAGAAAVALAVLAALVAAKSHRPTLWTLGVLLTISPLVLARVPALGDDTVFKAPMLVLLVLLWLRLGVRTRWPVALMLGALGLALAVSLAQVVPAISVDRTLAIKAFAGYFLLLAALMTRWRPEHLRDVLQVLVALPAVSIGLGVLLQVAGLWTLVSDGRLSGALIGPHLALLSAAAACAALTGLVVLGDRRWALWLLIDCGVAFLTLTRGALLASVVLLITLGAWTVAARSSAAASALRAGRLVLAVTAAAGLAALPLILARNQGNAYEGSFNTSGREQAWPFYLSLSSGSPLLGRGLGFASIANALLHPRGVQSQFQSPHNEYLHLWVDGGLLLAVPFFLGLIALGVVAGRRTGQRLLLAGVLGATLAYCFVDNNFSTPQYAVPFGLVLAALLADRRRGAEGGGRVTGPAVAEDDLSRTTG